MLGPTVTVNLLEMETQRRATVTIMSSPERETS